MKRYNTPGVSVAVVNDGRIEWAQGFGVTEAGTTNPINPATLFEAGSISKPVAATATLRLVEQGKLNLDEPVNTYLKSWKLPDNEFTATRQGTRLDVEWDASGTLSEVVFTSPTEAVILDSDRVFTLTKEESGRVSSLNFGSFKIPRKPDENPATK